MKNKPSSEEKKSGLPSKYFSSVQIDYRKITKRFLSWVLNFPSTLTKLWESCSSCKSRRNLIIESLISWNWQLFQHINLQMQGLKPKDPIFSSFKIQKMTLWNHTSFVCWMSRVKFPGEKKPLFFSPFSVKILSLFCSNFLLLQMNASSCQLTL